MNRSDVRTILETSLYRPVKVFLEGLGFVVKGEVGGCDLVALKGDGLPVVVICELKLTFNLDKGTSPESFSRLTGSFLLGFSFQS